MMLDLKWKKIVNDIEIVFEPLVSVSNAATYALSVSFSNYEQNGRYRSFGDLLDDAFNDGVLYQLDIELRKITFLKYKNMNLRHVKLIYPLDSRIMFMPDYRQGNSERILNKIKLHKKIFTMK